MLNFIQQNKYIKNIIFNKLCKPWARDKYQLIESYLKPDKKIIDIGAGKGALAWLLRERGYQVTPLDIKNLSLAPNIDPIIYNGQKIPFDNNQFDQALLLTVLHHTPDPEKILKETARVADEIIIIEDVYNNHLQKYLTYITDSIMNFEMTGHPHANKKDREWQQLFSDLNLKLRDKKENKVFNYFQQITYHLQVM